jgi:hypothetical protein
MTKYAPGKAKNQKCFKEISMSYETTMDAYIEEKLNTKLPKLFFISQPMAGKTDVEIAAERTMIKERIKREINPAATFIDSVLDKNKVEKEIKDKNVKSESLYYLAESLKLLSTADMAVFATGWEEARGCRVEEAAANEYGIKRHYI